jgi:putative copper resistance protein D
VPVLALAGIGLAFLLIVSWSTFRRGYGLILISKSTVFALLLILAALNRWRFTPALVAGPAPGAAATAAATATAAAAAARGALRRSIITEYLLLAGVVAMTAVLTSLYSPEH